MPAQGKANINPKDGKYVFLAELKSASVSRKKSIGVNSGNLQAIKGLIASFCEAMFAAFNSDVIFFIAGNEMKPFRLEVSAQQDSGMANAFLKSLDFINEENITNYLNAAGNWYIFFHVKGNAHWDGNFCVASAIMADGKNGQDGFFTIFGPWEKRNYIVFTTYKNGTYIEGFIDLWMMVAQTGDLDYMFEDGNRLPNVENVWYEPGLFKANPALKPEMFQLSWLGEQEQEPDPISPARSPQKKSREMPDFQPPEGIITDNGISGKTFLFTGTLSHFTREEAEAMVIFHGGKPLSGISSNLNYLVAGKDPGSKLEKASANPKIKILCEAEFQWLLPTDLDSEGNPNQILTRVNRAIMAELNEIIDESKSEFSGSFIEVNTRFGTYNLNATTGAYRKLLNGLVHWILFDKNLYHEFLNDDQIARLEKMVETDPGGIFIADEEKDDNYEFVQYRMLGRIYSSAFTFVARKLTLLNLEVSDELLEYLGG